MAFSELIKKFNNIRGYMRDFYVYGFKSREQFSAKSLRSYDNERRRIESWLSEYMSFKQSESGKNVFISVDSGEIKENPLYRAFKAKSFTKNDINLHFFIMDILHGGSACTAAEITDIINGDYLSASENPEYIDIPVVRNKLDEYTRLGLLKSEKVGNKLLYSGIDDFELPDDILTAAAFFSEVCPLGVIGGYILDGADSENNLFSFKHHYITHALESGVLLELTEAVREKRRVIITYRSQHTGEENTIKAVPLKLLISVQGGRRYLCAFAPDKEAFSTYRLDYILSVAASESEKNFHNLSERLEEILKYTWGVSLPQADDLTLERLEMELFIPSGEEHIIERIKSEGRQGKLEKTGTDSYTYSIEVYDPHEMLPWLRTFIGRIIKLECTDNTLVDIFYKDFYAMCDMYLEEIAV